MNEAEKGRNDESVLLVPLVDFIFSRFLLLLLVVVAV